MNNKILLDSSVIIDFLRRKDKENSLIFKLTEQKYAFYASIITHTEIYAGKSVWEERQAQLKVAEIFSEIKILPLMKEISEKAGFFRAKYNIDLIDTIVAATAWFEEIEIATLNRKDFEVIKGIKLLDF